MPSISKRSNGLWERLTEDSAAKVGARVAKATGEASGPRLEVAAGGDKLSLVLVVGNDLGELLLDVGRVLGLTTDAGEGLGGCVDAALLDVPTG